MDDGNKEEIDWGWEIAFWLAVAIPYWIGELVAKHLGALGLVSFLVSMAFSAGGAGIAIWAKRNLY